MDNHMDLPTPLHFLSKYFSMKTAKKLSKKELQTTCLKYLTIIINKQIFSLTIRVYYYLYILYLSFS